MMSDGSDKGLLGRALSLLYVAHHGLTEDELWGALEWSFRESSADPQNVSFAKREAHMEVLT